MAEARYPRAAVAAVDEAATAKAALPAKNLIVMNVLGGGFIAVGALLAVVEAGFRGPINIGTGEGVTVGSLAGTLASLAGRPDLVVLPGDAARDPFDHIVADASRLHALGWRPKVPLLDGLRRLVEARRA
jgi:nucleoside-diphosphate-sugar epimerase